MTGERRRTPVLLWALLVCGTTACHRTPHATVLATTTSIANSGLSEELVVAYRNQFGREVQTVAVGSGRALQMLAASQADVAITHSPSQEAQALAAHESWRYRKVLYNQFLIVGPPDDPAGVHDAPDAVAAMRRIAESPGRFVSRGDDSGTHQREKELWAAAGKVPAVGRLVVAGSGMGETLRIASETGSYTLTDEGTLQRFAARLVLRIVSRGDPTLLNTYAVLIDESNGRGRHFADWLADGSGRDRIADLLSRGAVRGFTLWPEHRSATKPDDLPW